MNGEDGKLTFCMSLPRSRTAWMAHVFSAGAATLHDPLKNCESISELALLLEQVPRPAIVFDTSAVFFHRKIAHQFPGAQYLFVERVPSDVEKSLAQYGIHAAGLLHTAVHQMRAAGVNMLSQHKTVRYIDYPDLDSEIVLHVLWNYFGCAADPPRGWFEQMIATNIQIPLGEQRANTNHQKVTKLFATGG